MARSLAIAEDELLRGMGACQSCVKESIICACKKGMVVGEQAAGGEMSARPSARTANALLRRNAHISGKVIPWTERTREMFPASRRISA